MIEFEHFFTENTKTPLYTKNGSVIKRYQDKVGKFIGGDLYIHKKYMKEVVPNDLLKNALKFLPKGTKFNTIVYNMKDQSIRFDEALNFDTDREPCAGNFIKVSPDGTTRNGSTQYIWHHKWLWVKDGYVGFDVQESYDWSKLWLSKLPVSPSGSMNVWKAQLADVGLDTIEEATQKYTSAGTSISQIAATFNRVDWEPNTVNLDYGGGKYDKATNFMKSKGVMNLVFDPFNRDQAHNQSVLNYLYKNGKADTATCNNVLNVILEPSIRIDIIKHIKSLLKSNGVAYFLIHSGDKSGKGKETSRGWQNNQETGFYVPEIQKIFANARKIGNLIIANN
jgi:hypothetical protein